MFKCTHVLHTLFVLVLNDGAKGESTALYMLRNLALSRLTKRNNGLVDMKDPLDMNNAKVAAFRALWKNRIG